MVKSDPKLKQDVEEELRWEPKINATHIGVAVADGAVTLSGNVDTYAEKYAAIESVRRVEGVRAIADDLTVKICGEHIRNDTEIAAAALQAMKWDVFVPGTVVAEVSNGFVTLRGQVDWHYQRDAAVRAVRNLSGVREVVNAITLKPVAAAKEVRHKIEAALQRQAATDAKAIKVETHGGCVTLSGHTTTWQARMDAEDAAWAAPGVTEVVDRVIVDYAY